MPFMKTNIINIHSKCRVDSEENKTEVKQNVIISHIAEMNSNWNAVIPQVL